MPASDMKKTQQHAEMQPCHCRDRGVTMLVRVDISAGTNGVLSVALSHQAAGFAPYRIDNCTAATLHLRQVRCAPMHYVVEC